MRRTSSRWIVFAGVALAVAAAQLQQFETTFDELQFDPNDPPPMRATLVDEHGKTIEVDAVAEPANDASTMELGADGTLSPRQQAIQMRWQKMLFDYLVDNAKVSSRFSAGVVDGSGEGVTGGGGVTRDSSAPPP